MDGRLLPYDLLYESVPSAAYYTLVGGVILVLFYATYTVADKHLSLSLQHLSRLCRLSPDVAGITLLSIGNGAPDFFTALFGAQQEPAMILGSSVGSGLFVMCVVFPLVILFGTSSPRGDVDTNGQTAATHTNGVAFLRGSLLYIFSVLSILYFVVARRIVWWQPVVLLSLYATYLAIAIAAHYCDRRATSLAAQRLSGFNHTAALPTGPRDGKPSGSIEMAAAKLQALGCFARFKAAFQTARKHSNGHPLLLPFAPIDFILNATLLPMQVPELIAADAEHIVALRYFHTLRSTAAPLATSLLLYAVFFWGSTAWLLLFPPALAASIFFAATSSWTVQPRFFPLHVFLAFVSCIGWIYVLTSELVECLSYTARISSISPTVIGILVLAWGNSFGDLITDTAMARNGALEMACSAVFSGPIQNILFTLGSAFLMASWGQRSVELAELQVDFYASIGALLAVLAIILGVTVWRGFRLERGLAWCLLGCYILYVPVAVVLGLRR